MLASDDGTEAITFSIATPNTDSDCTFAGLLLQPPSLLFRFEVAVAVVKSNYGDRLFRARPSTTWLLSARAP